MLWIPDRRYRSADAGHHLAGSRWKAFVGIIPYLVTVPLRGPNLWSGGHLLLSLRMYSGCLRKTVVVVDQYAAFLPRFSRCAGGGFGLVCFQIRAGDAALSEFRAWNNRCRFHRNDFRASLLAVPEVVKEDAADYAAVAGHQRHLVGHAQLYRSLVLGDGVRFCK